MISPRPSTNLILSLFRRSLHTYFTEVSASQVLFDGFTPLMAVFICKDSRRTSFLQTVDGCGKVFTQTLPLNLFDRILVRMKGEDNGFCLWQSMERLSLTAQKGLLRFSIFDLEPERLYCKRVIEPYLIQAHPCASAFHS